jgi:hypothetical protein
MTNVFLTYQLRKSRLHHCPAISLPFIAFGRRVADFGLRYGLAKTPLPRHRHGTVRSSHSILRQCPRSIRKLCYYFYALEILLHATQVVTMNLDMVTTPALLFCLQQTGTTLTSSTPAVDSNVMVSVIVCIDGLKSLENLNTLYVLPHQ